MSQVIDGTKSIDKARLDRQIGRLLWTVPRDLSQRIALGFLSHQRKSRRTAGLKCLDIDAMDGETSQYRMKCLDRTGDDRIVKALLQHPLRLNCIEPSSLLALFEGEAYWQMRVLEATIRTDRDIGISLAKAYPLAFIHAAGRVGDSRLLSALSKCFDVAEDKLALVGIVAWAYGKLGVHSEIIALGCVLEEFADGHGLNSAPS